MRLGEGLGNFDDLSRALLGTEVDRGPDCGRTHLVGLLHGPEHHLIEFVRIVEQFVVVDLHDERDLVSVLASHNPEHAERRSHGIAAPFDGQLDDVLGIEVIGVLGKAGSG
jgi:hypothetical protein